MGEIAAHIKSSPMGWDAMGTRSRLTLVYTEFITTIPLKSRGSKGWKLTATTKCSMNVLQQNTIFFYHNTIHFGDGHISLNSTCAASNRPMIVWDVWLLCRRSMSKILQIKKSIFSGISKINTAYFPCRWDIGCKMPVKNLTKFLLIASSYLMH